MAELAALSSKFGDAPVGSDDQIGQWLELGRPSRAEVLRQAAGLNAVLDGVDSGVSQALPHQRPSPADLYLLVHVVVVIHSLEVPHPVHLSVCGSKLSSCPTGVV